MFTTPGVVPSSSLYNYYPAFAEFKLKSLN